MLELVYGALRQFCSSGLASYLIPTLLAFTFLVTVPVIIREFCVPLRKGGK